MNEPERNRCEELSRLFLGQKRGPVDELAKSSGSFQDFRIRLVQRAATKDELAKRVAARWQTTIAKGTPAADANSLLHMLEGMAQRQAELERSMREARAEVLDHLKTLDTFATAQASWRASLDDLRHQMALVRKGLAQVDKCPATGGKK